MDTDYPDGPPEDAYLVNGEIYIWNETDGWHSAGSLQGPTGPTGPAGVITGSVESVADLPDVGNPGDMYLVDGVLYVWNETTQAWEAMGDLRGPTGPQGTGTTIKGTGVSKAQLDADYPNGPPEDAYLVDGEIYIWNETEGWHSAGSLQGPTGPTGPSAGSYTIIPFASQQAPFVHADAIGESTNVALIGFGYMEYSTLGGANVAFNVDTNDGSFNLGAHQNRQIAFSLPFDMRLSSLYITVGNFDVFPLPPTGTLVFPFVQIYRAEPGTNTFFPIPGALAKPEEGIDPQSAQAATMRSASVTGLDVQLPAGTRIAIGGRMEITGDTGARDYYLYYTGGLGMTFDM